MEQAVLHNPPTTPVELAPYPATPENRYFRNERVRPVINPDNSINNYLKTPAEMDAEFSMGTNTTKSSNWWQSNPTSQDEMRIFRTDSTDAIFVTGVPPGFMEENY